ncbi:hypothetical protein [Paraflavitalea speifideaquila]|uniref:hypothetical protein n=1 Tax=Paraflavitalea speifideaquila TaxID=3076558 RepID=UPI0028E34229|nr:hypothetical protein [Paraflavitalea speifideiaquila]
MVYENDRFINFLVIGLQPVGAQVKPEQAVAEAMYKLLGTYSRAPQLSFVVHYKYAAEDKPGLYLDSMRGEVKLHGSKSWYNLALTEYILNEDYQIMLFKEDQLIYLVKPSKVHISPLDMHMLGSNSLATFDSLITNDKDISCSYTGNASEENIQIVFARHPVYRKISWSIDRSTGYIKRSPHWLRLVLCTIHQYNRK